MSDDDLAPDYPPRTLHLDWTDGEPLTIRLDGVWDEWEIIAVLREAMAHYDAEDADAEQEP